VISLSGVGIYTKCYTLTFTFTFYRIFDSLFELDKSGRARGHSLKLKKRRINADLRQHLFSERIVNVWNALEDELVCSSSLNVFKNGLHQLGKNDGSLIVS